MIYYLYLKGVLKVLLFLYWKKWSSSDRDDTVLDRLDLVSSVTPAEVVRQEIPNKGISDSNSKDNDSVTQDIDGIDRSCGKEVLSPL